MINYPLLISAASAFVALFALIITWMNYRINRKMPNENKLFEEKFRSYRSIIAAFNTTAAVYVECGHEIHNFKGSPQTLKKFEDELNDELAKAYYLMEDTIYEQTLVLPDDVFESIDKYLNLFDQEDFLQETGKAQKTDEFEERINESFDEVINAMREDLALEKLDRGLRKRIGSRHGSQAIITTEG